MKKIYYLLLIIASLILSSCSAIEGIFKAGVWTSVFVIGVIVVILLLLLSRSKKS